DRGGHFRNGADLVGQVVGQQVDVSGEILPRTSGAGNVRLAAQPPFHADFAGHSRDLVGKGGEGSGHVVDGFRQGRDFALGVHRQLLGEVAVGHGGHYL